VSTINLFRSALDNSHEAIHVSGTVAIREALHGVDFENAVISVNGFQTDENHILSGNDICAIRLFPKGGSGGWNPIDTVLTVAAFIVNPVLGVMYAAATGISYAASGNTLGSWAAESMMPNLSGTSGAPNSQESLLNVPQLRGAKNQSNKNKPVPLIIGRHLYTPMYIGSPYTEIGGADGEDQYYNALYLLGWGKLKVSDIRLGPVSGLAKNPDISGNLNSAEGSWSWDDNPSFFGADFIDPSFKASNPQLELRQGTGEVWLYPQKVAEERLNIQLINIEDKDNPSENKRLEPIRFSAKNPQKVQVEITFNQGLISYDDKGNKKDASVGILVEWRADPNVDAWYEFGRFGTNGSLTHSPTQYNSATKTTTITRQKAKVMRFIAERSFTYAEVSNAPDRVVEIRVIRMSPKPVNDNRTADTVFLSAIRTWCFDNETEVQSSGQYAGQKLPQAPMIAKYRDKTARLGFRFKATDNLQGTIDALNCIVESYARTWNGSAWSADETPTNNPASVALKILQSPALGNNAYPDTMFDLDSFGEFYQWCTEREYTCNGVLTSEKRVDDLLNAVLSTGRGMRILNGSRYAILIDKPRENPVMILNSQNVLEAKNEKTFEDRPDGFSIKFINELDGYQETEVNVMADGSAAPGPLSKMESIEMPFVTDYKQAVKNGWYLLACRHLRPETWIRKLSVDGYLIGIGNRVEVQDDTIVVGIGEGAAITGFVIESGFITEIQTDGEFDVTDMGKLYGIKIMQFDGMNPGKVRTVPVTIPAPGVYSDFAVSIPLGDSQPVPHKGDIVAFGVFDRITTPALCFGKKDHGDGTFDVTLIPYQEGIYATDSGKIPPYESNTTTPQGLAPLHEIPPGQLLKSDVIELSKEFAGEPGKSAVVYQVIPSVDIIRKSSKGVMSPEVISCTQRSITGDGPPAPSDKTIKYITSLNSVEHDYTGPVDVDAGWEYIVFLLYDGETLLDFEDVPVIADGKPATVYELLPSANVVRVFDGGIDPTAVSCAQRSKTGTDNPVASDKTLVYVTSADPDGIVPYTGPVTINPAWRWIEFRLYDGATLLDCERVGIAVDGKPATVYDVLPSVSIIRKLSGGETVPDSVSCGQQMTAGNNPPAASDKTLVYVTSSNQTETAYTGAVTVDPAWEWIEFRLYAGDALLDRERIPVLADGTSPVIVIILNSNKSLSCDMFGNPLELPFTTQAYMYKGNDLITDESCYQAQYKKQILHFPGSGASVFDPCIGGLYPVNRKSIIWSIQGPPGVSVSEYGLITVAPDAALEDENEIFVTGVFDGVPYTTSLNVIKAYAGKDGENGENALFVELQQDGIQIRCDEYGDPYPDVFPIKNTAAFYYGASNILSPVEWSLVNAPIGVSIDSFGDIHIAYSLDYADVNEITVKGEYKDYVRTKNFTIQKWKDIPAPVVMNLNPDSESLMFTAFGAPKPGQLPCIVKAALFNGNEITDASRLPRLIRNCIVPFPGSGPGIFSPVGTYPVSKAAIQWSLSNAPPGVSVSGEGVITIEPWAQLADTNTVIVNAYYDGKIYSKTFTVSKVFDGAPGKDGDPGKDGEDSPKYLGKTDTPTSTNIVKILFTNSQSGDVQAKEGDYVAYVGADQPGASHWKKNYLLQWNGSGWVQLDPENSAYTDYYMGALRDIADGAGIGAFGTVLTRKLMALQVVADRLETEIIKLRAGGAIIGGAKYADNGSAISGHEDDAGFWLGADGVLKAASGEFSGGLSGRLMGGKHIYIHDNHRITSPRTLGQLYAGLRNININPGETDYNNILCSGFIRFSDSVYGDFYPRYIRTNSTNDIVLYGSNYSNGSLAPHTNHVLTSTSSISIINMELLVF